MALGFYSRSSLEVDVEVEVVQCPEADLLEVGFPEPDVFYYRTLNRYGMQATLPLHLDQHLIP